MSDPGETTIHSFKETPTDAPVKRGRGRPPKEKKSDENEKKQKALTNRARVFISDYYEFIEQFPEYNAGEPNIKSEMDLDKWEAKLTSLKRQQTLNEAAEALPINFFYLVQGLGSLSQQAYLYLGKDVELAARIGFFKNKLTEEYDLLSPLLIELIEKYPRLQTGKLAVELRLLYALKTLWDSTSKESIALEKEFNKNEIPSEYDGM